MMTSPVDSAVGELGDGFVSRTANVNGTTLHYVRGGVGPALILLHGFPQSRQYDSTAASQRVARRRSVPRNTCQPMATARYSLAVVAATLRIVSGDGIDTS